MKTLAAKPGGASATKSRSAVIWSKPSPLATVALCAGLGLLICACGEALSRGTAAGAVPVYWAGVMLLAVPIFWRLTARAASPSERLLLVCMLGVGLYLVKVMRDSPSFTFNDELIHAFNTNQIVAHHHLFHENPILAVTPFYPGMEGATSALTSIAGVSTYTAGTILIGAARLTLIASIFFLFRRVSGSARTAGIGAAIYAGNFNFFFYSAQYSYESLALPLLLLVLMMLAEREASPRQALREWAPPVGLAIAAIVVTHHLTSYATAAVIAALALVGYAINRNWHPPNPWRYAIYAALAAAAWLLLVANSTFGYLTPPISDAIDAIFNTVGGEAPPRGIFQSGSNIIPTPGYARALSLLAVAALTVALPFGLLRIARHYRRSPFALIFAVAAIGFFATLALRLAPAAWETGNRASEFFFVGLAFTIAVVGFEVWRPRRHAKWVRPGVTALLALILFGGAVSGWPWDMQLAQPLKVAAKGGTISSAPVSMAEWAQREVPGGRFAALTADANLLLTPGDKKVFSGTSPDVEDILKEPDLPSWQVPLLREHEIEYVVVDRRELANDGIRGYYFSRDDKGEGLYPVGVVEKFERLPGFSPVYSNGPITIFRDELSGR